MSSTSTIPASMKAWQFTSVSGGMEKSMEINKSARLPSTASKLAPDATLVQVVAMALNPVDYKIAELPVAGRIIPRPASPGLDYCGRVVSTGSALSSVLKPGQMVFGRLDKPGQFGTLAEYTITPKEGTVPVPEGITPEDAASIGTAGLTAYQSIVPNVNSGDWVFINGGSGGTGVYGIQVAKASGCHVTTSCSTGNVELCKSLGADEVIDYRSTDVTKRLKEGGQRFSLVVDNVGTPGDLYSECHHFVKPGGRFVQVGAEPSLGAAMGLASRMMRPSFLGGGKRRFEFVQVKNQREHFAQLGKWMKEGKVKAVVEKTYAFEEAVPAYERSKSGRTRGKVVVRVTEDS